MNLSLKLKKRNQHAGNRAAGDVAGRKQHAGAHFRLVSLRDRGRVAAGPAVDRLAHQPAENIGAEDESGRYTPTANGSDGTPLSSSTTAMDTPSSTSVQGSFLREDAVGNQRHQSGLGGAELVAPPCRRRGG